MTAIEGRPLLECGNLIDTYAQRIARIDDLGPNVRLVFATPYGAGGTEHVASCYVIVPKIALREMATQLANGVSPLAGFEPQEFQCAH